MFGPDKCLILKQNGEVVGIENATGDEEVFEGILLPGLINCHCHIELSHLKGKIPQHTGLVDFVMQVMQLRFADDAEKKRAMQAAIASMQDEGVVAVGDICNTADSIAQKKQSNIRWKNFVEVSGFVASSAQTRFNAGVTIAKQFDEAVIVPHAPYSVSNKLFELIGDANADLISIHNQETEEEDRFLENKEGGFLKLYKAMGVQIDQFQPTGNSSMHAWLPYFTKQQIISVHNTFTHEEDLDFAMQHPEIFFCVCINANLYIENKVPDLDLFLKKNAQIVIGTDSLASNQRLSILEEMRVLQEQFPHVSLATILTWATSNGAKALQFDQLGSFEKGKTPGVVLLQHTQQLRIDENSRLKKIL